MGIVYVSHLETCTIARQTARTQCRHTAFVRDFRQRVGLVHELGQSIRAEERIDDRRNRLGINQINRREHLIVADLHTLTDSTRHTCQTNGELIGQLLAHRAHTTVAQVVNIIDNCLGVDKFNQILDNLNDIFLRKHADTHVCRQIQLLVDSVTAYIAQIISLFREEQIINNLTGTRIISRVCITQLAIDIQHCLLLRVTRVFLQRIIDNRIIRLVLLFLVNQNILNTRFKYDINVFRLDNCFTVNHDLITLNGNNFTGIFIHKILNPCLQDAGCQFTTNHLLQISLVDFHLLGQIEYLKNVLVVFKSDGSQQCSNRQFLFTVDISIHHIVDVRGKFNPRSLERNDTSRIQLGTIGVHALTEEDARRTVQLRNDYALCSINHKCGFLRHIRDRPQEHILNHRIEILVIRVGTIQFQFGLQRNTVSEPPLYTFIDAITRRINIIVQKFKDKIISCIGYGEVLSKYFIQSLVLTFLGRSIQL